MHKPFILCVDDEELSLRLRKLVLEKQGYQVVTSRSSLEAMRVLAGHPVDMILTDQVMAGGTGPELAQFIKKNWPDLPVILISGMIEVPPDAMHADVFISKVEGPPALCAMISALLPARWSSFGQVAMSSPRCVGDHKRLKRKPTSNYNFFQDEGVQSEGLDVHCELFRSGFPRSWFYLRHRGPEYWTIAFRSQGR